MRFTDIRQFVVGAALATTIGLGGAAGVLAQDAEAELSQPAHLHVGTCADLDPNPVAPLNNLLPVGVERNDDGTIDEDADNSDLETLGVLTNGPVTYSETDDIDLKWEDMLGSSHAIAVHESDANIQNYIACADIGGVVFDDDDDTKLVVGLQPVNDSGFSGIAILTEDDDGEVDVEVYVAGAPSDSDADIEATPQG